jgi:hypothetical protein
LVDRTRLGAFTVVSAGAENILAGKAPRCTERVVVTSLDELPGVLAAASSDRPRTLDLLGHTTGGAKLLRLGSTVVDMTRPAVARVFDEIGESGVLAEKQLVAVRLIGCSSAVMPAAQLTLRLLARSLRLPAYGSRKTLIRAHYDSLGFNPIFAGLLIESRHLPNPPQMLRSM